MTYMGLFEAKLFFETLFGKYLKHGMKIVAVDLYLLIVRWFTIACIGVWEKLQCTTTCFLEDQIYEIAWLIYSFSNVI